MRNFDQLVNIIQKLEIDRVCDLPHSVISKIAETEFEVKVLATQNDRLSSQAIRLEQLLKQKQNTL